MDFRAAMMIEEERERERGKKEFKSVCEALKRNDPRTTKVDVKWEYPSGYGRELGIAIRGNEHVTHLSLRLSGFFMNGRDTSPHWYSALLDFLRESKKLRNVTIYEGVSLLFAPTRLCADLLRSITENPHDVDFALRIYTDLSAVETFVPLMRKKRHSMTELEIHVHARDHSTTQRYVHGFSENQVLQRLVLHDCSTMNVVQQILTNLSFHPKLHELVLSCESEMQKSHIAGLSTFLGETAVLTHLELDGYEFDEELMQSLVNGLQRNRTLVKLAFTGRGCMDEGAISQLSRFMRASNTSSTLREFKILGEGHANLFEGTDIVATMLTRPKNQASSIGSSIQILTLGLQNEGDIYAPLFSKMAARSADTDIACLRLDGAGWEEWEALAEVLPSWAALKELHFEDYESMNKYFDPDQVVRVLCGCSNLLRVSMTERKNRPNVGKTILSLFKRRHRQKNRVYCKRNEMLPKLLCAPRPNEGGERAHAPLFPMLFDVAGRISLSRPSFLLMGLLSLDESIGRRRDQKRKTCMQQ
jgi:hypothetical protein